MNPAVLHAKGISVRRGAAWCLAPCDLQVAAGEVLTIYGPNGAGKSTLLQGIARLVLLQSGEVRLNDQVVGRELSLLSYHRRTAAVFQEPLLLRGTVWHNVTLGLRLRGVSPKEQSERAHPWLERLRIEHLKQRPIGTLSAGEAQRTSLARALVLEPEVLFLDEPFAALDAPTRRRLVGELAEILSERQSAVLFVTHDLAEARRLSKRAIVLDAGHIVQEGSLEQMIGKPASPRVAEILGLELGEH